MGDGQEKQKVELETKQGRRRLRVKSNNGSWRPGEHIFGQPPKTITPFSIHKNAGDWAEWMTNRG
jgi:hypothetical protein